MIISVFRLFPRNKKMWVTGKVTSWEGDFTPPQFFDNSKYFYLYLVENTDEKVYWISSSASEIELLQKLNLPVVKAGSLKSMLICLRAKYFFHHYGTNQIEPRLQYGAVHIDLWHGTPLKKIRYDVVPKVIEKKKVLIEWLDRGSEEYVSSTSKYLSKSILARAFDVPESRLLDFGYPRTDIMKLNKMETLEFCKKYSRELVKYIELANQYRKVFLYMPTWRDNDPDYFSKAKIDFERWNKKLKESNSVLFLKLHPLTKAVDGIVYDHIFFIDNDVDIYPFLVYTDFLITDYSSIFFDYLLLDKEIIFIPYDYEDYINNRSLYFEYDEVTPGKKYFSFDDFITDFENLDKLDYAEERRRVKDRFIEDYAFDASEKIYNFFKEK